MFTGIVQAIGTITEIVNHGEDSQFTIVAPEQFLDDTNIGDSICVQGVCLTIVDIKGSTFAVDVSNETLQCTTLGDKTQRSKVNLELALTLATRLGGHLVSGHVDGVGEVAEIGADGESIKVVVRCPYGLAKYIARKGSICIDGVSLTVNVAEHSVFSVNIIPHTSENTTINEYVVGSKVNLEVDVIARYVERLQIQAGNSSI